MARTVNLRLTGKAAVTDKAEQRTEMILAQPARLTAEKMQHYRTQLDSLMQACYDIEGEAFTTWWDDDSNVPAVCDIREQINYAGTHLATLRRRYLYTPSPVTLAARAAS